MSRPEHDKLRAVRPHSQQIHEFIVWLAHEKNIILAEDVTGADELMPSRARLTDLVAAFYEIDQNKLEAEKLAMLDTIRDTNKRRETESFYGIRKTEGPRENGNK